MACNTQRVLVLAQKTAFCRHVLGMVAGTFGDRVLCDTFSSYAQGREAAAAHAARPIALIWGDGRCHHFSNIINIPSSLKYVFDEHGDFAASTRLEYDSHNTFSQDQGISLRVCRGVGRHGSFHFYDEREADPLHVSLDLDCVGGFPALPWMSTGDTRMGRLADYAGAVALGRKLMRLDMGGYHEMGKPGMPEMGRVYGTYYECLIRKLLPMMMG